MIQLDKISEWYANIEKEDPDYSNFFFVYSIQ